MPSKMTAEQYATEHGAAMVEWLRDNTVECACALPFGCDDAHRTGGVIDAETQISCRRCFVPIGLHDVLHCRPRV